MYRRMDKLNIKSCPLCDSSQITYVFSCTDYYASGEQFELFRCNNCNFMFTQNFPLGNRIDRYYISSGYISHTDTKKGIINRLYHRVRKHMLRKKLRLVLNESHRKEGKLLDIGCGTGYFAAAIKKTGWEVEAIEKNEQARAFAHEKFKLDVKDEAELMNYAPKTFDVITLWHVMEHLENLDTVWSKLNDILKDTGILIVAVPNNASYDAEKYGPQWAAYDVPRHLWHFAPATMQQWGVKHGFLLAARYPMPFDAFYISMLSEKNKKSKYAFLKGMSAGTWAGVKALAKKDKSSSLIYIFRKKRNEKKAEN